MRTRRWLVTAACLLAVACGGTETAAPDAASPSPVQPTAAPGPTAAPEPTSGSEQGDATPSPAPTATIPPGERSDLSLLGPEGQEATFSVEVVAEPAARQQGLMHRTELPQDAGMLFLFPREHRGGFWMKNTLIPLSIAFIDADGEILRILDMEPCEADPCPSYEPGVAYHAALEVNQGAFDEAGVAEGWHVDLEGLPAAS